MPAGFDAPLAPHHKLIGRWAAARDKTARRYSRYEARCRIESLFGAAVLEILNPFELADLRVVVLQGEGDLPPALSIVCDSVGQLDLGWIEKSNTLANSLVAHVAPLGWRAAAYKALTETLNCALPIFGYQELFDEMSMYYWDGETDDDGARRVLIDYHGHDVEDLDDTMLPSGMNSARPDWMLAENADPLKQLPAGLSDKLRHLREAYKAVRTLGAEGNAWHFDTDVIITYVPDQMDCSPLPPLTLVPFDHFARELDTVAQHGMETGFMDITGICQLTDASTVDQWFASLKIGADFLLAAQDLINFDPTKRGPT